MLVKTIVNFRTRLKQDEGEVGSWVLVAALLAIAALAAGQDIAEWIGNNVTQITSQNP